MTLLFDDATVYRATGDRKLRDKLVEKYIKIAEPIAQRSASRLRLDFDELYSAAMRGVLFAVENFDPSRGMKLSTYCHQCAIWFVGKDAGRQINARKSTPMSQLGADDQMAMCDLELGVEDKALQLVEDRELWERAMRRLSNAHRKVIRLYYRNGLCDPEIGQKEGVSRQAVNSRRKSALEECRKTLASAV